MLPSHLYLDTLAMLCSCGVTWWAWLQFGVAGGREKMDAKARTALGCARQDE